MVHMPDVYSSQSHDHSPESMIPEAERLLMFVLICHFQLPFRIDMRIAFRSGAPIIHSIVGNTVGRP